MHGTAPNKVVVALYFLECGTTIENQSPRGNSMVKSKSRFFGAGLLTFHTYVPTENALGSFYIHALGGPLLFGSVILIQVLLNLRWLIESLRSAPRKPEAAHRSFVFCMLRNRQLKLRCGLQTTTPLPDDPTACLTTAHQGSKAQRERSPTQAIYWNKNRNREHEYRTTKQDRGVIIVAGA